MLLTEIKAKTKWKFWFKSQPPSQTPIVAPGLLKNSWLSVLLLEWLTKVFILLWKYHFYLSFSAILSDLALFDIHLTKIFFVREKLKIFCFQKSCSSKKWLECLQSACNQTLIRSLRKNNFFLHKNCLILWTNCKIIMLIPLDCIQSYCIQFYHSSRRLLYLFQFFTHNLYLWNTLWKAVL